MAVGLAGRAGGSLRCEGVEAECFDPGCGRERRSLAACWHLGFERMSLVRGLCVVSGTAQLSGLVVVLPHWHAGGLRGRGQSVTRRWPWTPVRGWKRSRHSRSGCTGPRSPGGRTGTRIRGQWQRLRQLAPGAWNQALAGVLAVSPGHSQPPGIMSHREARTGTVAAQGLLLRASAAGRRMRPPRAAGGGCAGRELRAASPRRAASRRARTPTPRSRTRPWSPR